MTSQSSIEFESNFSSEQKSDSLKKFGKFIDKFSSSREEHTMAPKNNTYVPNVTPFLANDTQYAQPTGNGGGPHVQVIKPTDETENTGWRDLPFAILFLLNVIAIAALMVIYGIPVLSEKTSNDGEEKETNYLSGDDTKQILYAAAGMSIAAAVLSLLALKVLLKYARTIIQISLGYVALHFFIQHDD